MTKTKTMAHYYCNGSRTPDWSVPVAEGFAPLRVRQTYREEGDLLKVTKRWFDKKNNSWHIHVKIVESAQR